MDNTASRHKLTLFSPQPRPRRTHDNTNDPTPREPHDAESLRRVHYPHIITLPQYESSWVEPSRIKSRVDPIQPTGLTAITDINIYLTQSISNDTILPNESHTCPALISHLISVYDPIAIPHTTHSSQVSRGAHKYQAYFAFSSLTPVRYPHPSWYYTTTTTYKYNLMHVLKHVDERFVCPCTTDRIPSCLVYLYKRKACWMSIDKNSPCYCIPERISSHSSRTSRFYLHPVLLLPQHHFLIEEQ